MPRPFLPSRRSRPARPVTTTPVSSPSAPSAPPSAAVGRPITLVVDHLPPETLRRVVAVFDRPRGTPLACGQLLDLHTALDLLPHGSDYGLLIGLWNFLPAAARDAWMAEGRAHVHQATIPAAPVSTPLARPIVKRGRRGRRGRVLHAPGAFRGTR